MSGAARRLLLSSRTLKQLLASLLRLQYKVRNATVVVLKCENEEGNVP